MYVCGHAPPQENVLTDVHVRAIQASYRSAAVTVDLTRVKRPGVLAARFRG